MRNAISILMLLGLMTAATDAVAQLTVSEVFHVDPGWEAGGYWELTVTNNTGDNVFFVAVGNTGADLVVVRYPDLIGWWNPNRIADFDWDLNEFTFHGVAWTPPVLSDYPMATYFPGSAQVLIYYVMGAQPPLATGAARDGLYFNYPIEAAMTASTRPAASGSPFLAFNGEGELVAEGVTVGAPLATQATTWGSIKALYR